MDIDDTNSIFDSRFQSVEYENFLGRSISLEPLRQDQRVKEGANLRPARTLGLDPEVLKPFVLLTAHPVLYVGNTDGNPDHFSPLKKTPDPFPIPTSG